MRLLQSQIAKLLVAGLALGSGSGVAADACVACHAKVTPAVVKDWRLSKHSGRKVGCATCHGHAHGSRADAARAELPGPETCGKCHAERLAQFRKGKHALGWAAMKALPTWHLQPAAMTEGMKGCGGCHKIGVKRAQQAEGKGDPRAARFESGNASCDACHTRHVFSVKEARQPQACMTCHTGGAYAEWETYSTSKHGVRFMLQQAGIMPAGSAAPTCQTCHMRGGDHEVREAWGTVALRPNPEDEQWSADRATILQALGSLDPDGKPTGRVEASKPLDMARPTPAAWLAEREKMVKACEQCHSEGFARRDLAKGDATIRAADHLVAEAIRAVAGLYKDGVLKKPASYAYAFPDLLTLRDAPTPIELRLLEMFLIHRRLTIQGAFHGSPLHAFDSGWAALRVDLTEIDAMAEELRRGHRAAAN
jgi:hydroxylamine dehydrogenase